MTTFHEKPGWNSRLDFPVCNYWLCSHGQCLYTLPPYHFDTVLYLFHSMNQHTGYAFNCSCHGICVYKIRLFTSEYDDFTWVCHQNLLLVRPWTFRINPLGQWNHFLPVSLPHVHQVHLIVFTVGCSEAHLALCDLCLHWRFGSGVTKELAPWPLAKLAHAGAMLSQVQWHDEGMKSQATEATLRGLSLLRPGNTLAFDGPS